MSAFIPGLELSRLFFEEAVRPVLSQDFPGLRYSAALIGTGSEVLGFDTPMSMDHDWGPRLMLFVEADALPKVGNQIQEVLGQKLPFQFRGYSTGFEVHSNGSGVPQTQNQRPIPHRVRVYSLDGYLQSYLGWRPSYDLTPADWLSFPQQKLLAVTAGAVYQDEVGLQAVRERLAYYPHDVWLYLLAAQWQRIGQEEHLAGRAGLVGDELGSALIALRLVHDIMLLCFLMEKVYAPYPKWFGSAFSQLRCASRLAPLLHQVLAAQTWQRRNFALAAAYEAVATQHHTLGITKQLPASASQFYDRPIQVIWGGRYAQEIVELIKDENVRSIAKKSLIGGIDQFSDNTDLLGDAALRETIKWLYREEG